MYEILIAFRYIRSGRVSGFVNFISILATLGIALGVAALIIVLSVMNGFQKEVRDKMLSVLSHVEVYSSTNNSEKLKKISSLFAKEKNVVATAPFTYSQAMLVRGGQVKGVIVRGIDPIKELNVSEGLSNIINGQITDLKEKSFGVIIGNELAKSLNVKVSDYLMLVTAENTSSPLGVFPRIKKFQIKAVFSSGHYEYDQGLVFIHQTDSRNFFKFSGVEGIRAKLTNMHLAPEFASKFQNKISENFIIRDWTKENKNWFAAVQVEKRMMFIILMLIIAVAAFNLVAMLVMTVTDKRSDIAILRTIGAHRWSILFIFIVQGAFLGLFGVILGTFLGVIGALNLGEIIMLIEKLFDFEVLPKGIYLINTFPSDLRISDVTTISIISFSLSILATIYPSLKASKIHPAEALRYE